MQKNHPREDNVIQYHIQAGKTTTNLKVNIDYTLPELSSTKIFTWNCHLNDSAKGIYYTILGRYVLDGVHPKTPPFSTRYFL